MERSELEQYVSVYEGGYADIQSILEDDDLKPREKLEAIADVVNGDGDEADDAEA